MISHIGETGGATQFTRVPILDVWVTPASSAEIVDWILTATDKKRLMNHNLHSVLLAHTNAEFSRSYVAADAVVVDGYPLSLLLRLGRRGGSPHGHERVGSCDWIIELERRKPSRVNRIAVLGASPESNAALLARFSKTLPHAEVRGWDGYDGLSELIIDEFAELSEFKPNLVLLGLGMPKQEILLEHYYGMLPRAVYATVGGAIDQLSGFQIMPPRVLGPLGLEWIYRLVRDPRRLAYRYLIEPIHLAALLLRRRFTGSTERKAHR